MDPEEWKQGIPCEKDYLPFCSGCKPKVLRHKERNSQHLSDDYTIRRSQGGESDGTFGSESYIGYRIALGALRRLRPRLEGEALEHYLQSIRPSLLSLRKRYRNMRVENGYSQEEDQHAYLLGYLPPYFWTAISVLNRDELKVLTSRQSVTAAFLCAGPGTEAAALTHLLKSRADRPRRLDIELLDIDCDEWAPVQSAVMREVVQLPGAMEVSHRSRFMDLTKPETLSEHREVFERCNLVMMQNCLNEVPDDGHSIDALSMVWSFMPSKSHLVLTDLKYSAWENVAATLRKRIEAGSIPSASSFQQMTEKKFMEKVPNILSINFFQNEDFLRARTEMKFGYLIFTKA